MDEAANPQNKQTASIRYVDVPECGETFADSVVSVFFDGQTMRLEFGITRMDDMKQGGPLTGRRYPACRLVLPVNAAIDLINKMQQTGTALQQAGLVKQTPTSAAPQPEAASPSPTEARLAGLAGLAQELQSSGLRTPSSPVSRPLSSFSSLGKNNLK